MMWQWHSPADWGVMGIWMILWVVLVVAAISLTIWLIARLIAPRDGSPRDGGPSSRGGDDAEMILRRRFAAGEIDAEEYERRLEVLRRGR